MNKKNKKRKKTTSCGCVVWRIKNGRIEILLIKPSAHKECWGIPKGHVNDGESLEECAVREVNEETGIKVKLGARLPDCFISKKVEDKTVISWLAQAVGSDEPSCNDPDNEVADACWFDVAELPKIVQYQRQLIATAVNAVFNALNNGNVVRPT
jgi:8-oxo-dGTP diphosphatase